MNPNQPSREQIEARITALLLGELPADEAALLRWAIAHDAELKKLHDRLELAVGLVREVAVKPTAAVPLKLSDERREKLLAHFQTPRPKAKPVKELFWLKPIPMLKVPRLIEVLVVVAIVALLAAMMLPALSKAKNKARSVSAMNQAKMRSMEALSADQSDAPQAINMERLAREKFSAVQTAQPSPVVAPPPSEIVLPKPDSSPEASFQNGTLADSGNGHVFSQNVVGFGGGGGFRAGITQSDAIAAPAAAMPPAALPVGGVVEEQRLPGVVASEQANFALANNQHTIDTQKRMTQVENQFGMVPPHALDAGVASGSAGGATGGAHGGGQPQVAGNNSWNLGSDRLEAERRPADTVQNGVTLAWNDNADDRPGFVGSPQNLGDANGRPTSTGKAGINFKISGSSYDSATPTGALPGAEAETVSGRQTQMRATRKIEERPANGGDAWQGRVDNFGIAGNGSVAEERLPGISSAAAADKDTDGRLTKGLGDSGPTSGSFNFDTADLAQNRRAAGEKFYRNTGSGVDADKVPVLGDMPVAGNLFSSASRVALPSSAPTAPAPAKKPGKAEWESFDGSLNEPVIIAGTAKELTKSGSGTLALNGANAYTGGTTVSGGTLTANDSEAAKGFKVDAGKFYLGLTRDDVNGFKYQLAANQPAPAQSGAVASVGGLNYITQAPQASQPVVVKNSVALADVAASSIAPGFSPSLDTAQLQALHTQTGEVAKTKDQAESTKNQPYYDAKRNLEQLRDQHNLLYAKIEAEKLDAEIPKTSMVQITDIAEPTKSQTLWQKFTGEVESKAHIKVENDVNDNSGGSTMTVSQMSYDPYFIQTTFEIIQSDAVLGKVVDALKLDEAWANNYGGGKLEKKTAIALLKKRLDLKPVRNTKLIEIGATSDQPEEAAKIANAVADAYRSYRLETRRQTTTKGMEVLAAQYDAEGKAILAAQAELARLEPKKTPKPADQPLPKPALNAPVPQPEVLCRENNFSTFSLNVSDVSFKLAEASLQNGRMPDAASIRSEEFINAFDYRDPEAAAGQPVAFTSERARYPFAQNRDLLRFSIKTAAAGRAADRPLNLVLLLDKSGSMERADRVAIIREALRVLVAQLQPQDTVSVVTFARTARLWADGVSGDKAGETLDQVGGITPEGGTNLEEAMRLAYETARRHYLANGINRVVLLTDGATNLGNVDAAVLKQKVETQRKQGIALDCFGIGWEDFNDDMLAELSGNGDGRYAFINTPEEAGTEFAAKLAGALQVAAQDVKVQVEFNPQRVISWRQIGYAKHQLTKEQFRDNSVLAAEIAAQEAGNALYTVETKPDGSGPVATVHVRYKIPGTEDVREHSWDVDYTGNAPALEQSSAAMRLAATASAFSEWLAASPLAQEVSPDELLKTMSGVPEIYGADQRPQKLVLMLLQAKSLSGK